MHDHAAQGARVEPLQRAAHVGGGDGAVEHHQAVVLVLHPDEQRRSVPGARDVAERRHGLGHRAAAEHQEHDQSCQAHRAEILSAGGPRRQAVPMMVSILGLQAN